MFPSILPNEDWHYIKYIRKDFLWCASHDFFVLVQHSEKPHKSRLLIIQANIKVALGALAASSPKLSKEHFVIFLVLPFET